MTTIEQMAALQMHSSQWFDAAFENINVPNEVKEAAKRICVAYGKIHNTMKPNTVTYETGATSHAVNDLILFTDNTRGLAELRDKIYQSVAFKESCPNDIFLPLLDAAQLRYYNEFKTSNKHITNMSAAQNLEYCNLYAKDFNNWKSEHGYK
jgi:hypothetical protein